MNRRSDDGGTLPLDGLLVVALEQAVAVPIATRHLADLGARVIKIERPGEGDFARGYDSGVRGLSTHFVWLNRSKESVCIDLKSDDGLAFLRSLIAKADVFLQNLGPGSARRLGLDAETLRCHHADLIVVDVSGYGTSGPFQARKAYDMLIQAESGMISVTGSPTEPAKTGAPVADIATGMYVAISVLAALVQRSQTGHGAAIDVTMFDAAVEWMGHPMYAQLYEGRQVPRMGLSHAAIAPYDAYPTRDGDILIGVQNDRGWRALVTEVFDAPDVADDPRFLTNELRAVHRVECDAYVASETRKWSIEDIDRRLAEVGIPAGRLNGLAEVVDHPQLSERKRWRMIDTEVGAVRALLPPMTFSDVELRMDPVPSLGQHTRSVREEMGIVANPEHVIPNRTRQ